MRSKKLQSAVLMKPNKLKNVEDVVNVKKRPRTGNLIKTTKMTTRTWRMSSVMKVIPWYESLLYLHYRS
jgi:hypothetical protein